MLWAKPWIRFYFIKDILDKKLFDAFILPVRVPSDDSFAWVLLKDKEILENSVPEVKGVHNEADALSEKMAKKIEKEMSNAGNVMIHFCPHYGNIVKDLNRFLIP